MDCPRCKAPMAVKEIGEIKIGGVLPLLRNSSIDSRRFARRDAELPKMRSILI